ncbi:Uncharacterised protein [Mycobacteroides abscessus subsp. abscessus]|nr:Uncharacterised protein [Mycobacteroides abscessus subsp. abscessus]
MHVVVIEFLPVLQSGGGGTAEHGFGVAQLGGMNTMPPGLTAVDGVDAGQDTPLPSPMNLHVVAGTLRR